MTAHEIICIIAAFCGLSMVLGGILLLYKGAITLSAKSEGEALSVEFKRMFRMNTQYPALGLFVIGVVFILVATNYSQSTPMKLRGKVLVDDPSLATLRVVAGQLDMGVGSDSSVVGDLFPASNIQVLVSAPGYRPWQRTIPLARTWFQNIDLGEINLGLRQVTMPTVDPINIAEPSSPLPSVDSSGAFQ